MKNQKELIFVIPYNSVDEIPMEEYKHLHKAYWEFIAENRLTRKPEIRLANGEPAAIDSWCFACQYAKKQRPKPFGSQCDYCPLTGFRDSIFRCYHYTSIFRKWSHVPLKDKYALAMEIANLEWEDG